MVGVFGMFIAVVVILTTCVHSFQLPTKQPNLKRHILYSSIQIADVSALVSESQLTANVLMSCVMAGIGDTVAQVQTQKQNKGGEYNLENLDKKRLKNFILKGFGSGILWSYCFALSDQWCTAFAQSQDIGPEGVYYTLSSMMIDQFLWSPIIFSLWDIPFPLLLRGTRFSEIPAEVNGKVRGLLWENAKVWTFINIVVYNIPLEWRVIITTLGDLFWQSIVSETVSPTEEEICSTARDESTLKNIAGNYVQ